MAVEFDDGFTEGSDTALESHTPDTTGTGWTVAGGAVHILAATDVASDNNNSSGNRYNCTDQFSSADLDVEGVFRNPGGDGTFFWGPRARLSSNSVQAGPQFNYSHTANTTGGYELLSDTTTEDWGGDPTTMKLECRGAGATGLKGYADGVEKVSGQDASSNKYCGIVLGNFEGVGVDTTSCDDFKVTTVAAAGANPKGPLGHPFHGPFAGPVN